MVAQMDVTYEVDGTTMVGRLARPDRDGRRPGVLIAHEGNGLDDVQKARPARFAELGYVAFALDYHGGGRPLEDRAAINARLKALGDHPGRTRRIARAGLDILRRENPTKVAAVGYCFGGTLVLELGRSGADLAAIVGFHPGLTTKRPEDSVHIRGPVLMCVGADDPLIRVEQRLAFEAEMRAAGVDWRMNIYGGAKHSFTHPRATDFAGLPGLEYDARTDARSWRAMLDLFDEVFTPATTPK
ncbi:MAG TPA: dienelactone hydrolase family protein [Acidimicrobiales bacterium]|nr:dienelactone hydrolase family protein [Acidimicrobiales bacterium]